MTLAALRGVPDEALLDEMTVYVDPIKTERRYQPGVEGVAASLPRLESLAYGNDLQSIASVLGDMAMCMNIACPDFPWPHRFRSDSLQFYFPQLEAAVLASDEPLVRSLLGDTLHAAGLTPPNTLGEHYYLTAH